MNLFARIGLFLLEMTIGDVGCHHDIPMAKPQAVGVMRSDLSCGLVVFYIFSDAERSLF